MQPWYVITGAPSSGKSTLLDALSAQGHHTVPEAARTLIDTELAEGKSIHDIRSNEHLFQQRVLQLKLDTEATLPKAKPLFFERGIPDSTAYYRLYGYPESPELTAALGQCVYRHVFLLDIPSFEADYARTETGTSASRIDQLLEQAYLEVGIKVTRIPVVPVEDRASLILAIVKRALI